ncbi:MAG TPA: HD domain-containing protein [Candidatus Dormibacteraeota bacterium]|nr:HD domain-containing protein [Candidatus Dormibacteraeota bacterium]
MKRIFDPIHGFIELTEPEVALMDSVPFQRLRRLRQLGLAYLAFPSAEHSRFTHALGALAMGTHAIEALRAHSPEYFRGDRDYDEQRRLLRVALLLHDLGHGPFSHASEAVLGRRHETRTEEMLALPELRAGMERARVDPAEVLGLIVADRPSSHPVLKELVSGPNLDCDRMDYLQRDAYFTGVSGGRYDVAQLVASLRVLSVEGEPRLGIDGRGLVALEQFVLARYMMFATVYFHHTTRAFERALGEALRELWTRPQDLDGIEEFLAWDDFRVMESLRPSQTPAARALRDRVAPFALAAEFNGEGDLTLYETCERVLRERFGDDVWGDAVEERMRRGPALFVHLMGATVEAAEASDLIRRLSGKAYWRKLFVRRGAERLAEARRLCAQARARRSPTWSAMPLPF